MVWVEISLGDPPMLHERTPIDVIYSNEILDPYGRLYAGATGKRIILMDDNDRHYGARHAEEFLENQSFLKMDCPVQSDIRITFLTDGCVKYLFEVVK
ncbi:hypothetical protein AVEN_195563-1 [Araneus ventricosus]|uniref:Uncharacterized protein n=1 Tax=Araneus ventricosus TaxID=182803 RepID=A0A4Y2EXJ5_ARAVE|nr:hypothetical protein AVEN_195563-1 [Araneus ventricosus]